MKYEENMSNLDVCSDIALNPHRLTLLPFVCGFLQCSVK
jgi:hypothetical protein